MKKWLPWLLTAFAFYLLFRVSAERSAPSVSSVPGHSNAASNVAVADTTECTASKINLRGLRGITEDGDWAIVTGLIHNGCDEAYGVQLKIALYAKDGTVIDDDDPWPASISNIPAHSDFPFRASMSPHGDWTRFSVGVMDIKQW